MLWLVVYGTASYAMVWFGFGGGGPVWMPKIIWCGMVGNVNIAWYSMAGYGLVVAGRPP